MNLNVCYIYELISTSCSSLWVTALQSSHELLIIIPPYESSADEPWRIAKFKLPIQKEKDEVSTSVSECFIIVKYREQQIIKKQD